MPSKVEPLFFHQVAEQRLLTSRKSSVESVAIPKIQRLESLPGSRSCLSSLKASSAFTNGSAALSAFDRATFSTTSLMDGGGATGLITLSSAVTGPAQVYDNWNQYRRYCMIGDRGGANLAKLQGIENVSLTAASMAMIPLRGITLAQEIKTVMCSPLSLTGTLGTTQAVFSGLSTLFYTIYYVLSGIRHGRSLVQWTQGRKWRQELLSSSNPIKEVKNQLNSRIQNLNLSTEEYKRLALEAGARWLEGVVKEGKKNGTELSFNDPKSAFEQYVKRHPEVIDAALGSLGFVQLTWEGQLIRLGKYLAIRNESVKFEAECLKKLGSKTVEALKSGNIAKTKEALASNKEMVMRALKVSVAVIGLFALIAATVLTGGAPVAVILALVGIGALLSIFLEDLDNLKAHLENGEFRKRDRFFIYFSLVLSVIAVCGLVTLTVLSGGVVPFLAALILTSAWLIVNIRTTATLSKYDHRPWDAQKQPTLQAFRQMLETKPSKEKVRAVYERMSKEDRGILQAIEENHLKVLLLREKTIKDAQDLQRAGLIEDLKGLG